MQVRAIVMHFSVTVTSISIDLTILTLSSAMRITVPSRKEATVAWMDLGLGPVN